MVAAGPAVRTGSRAGAAERTGVGVATGAAALELLDDEWDRLLHRQRLPNPTLCATWLRHLARWDTGLPLVVVAESGGRLVAGAALELHRPTGRFGPALATWLGPAEQLQSPDVLVDPGVPRAGEAVLDAVLGVADLLHVAAPASGPAARALAAVAPWHRAQTIEQRWIVACPPPRLAYARRRADCELRWAERRGAQIDVRVAREPGDVAVALEHLFRLHRFRWDGRADLNGRFASTARHRAWNRDAIAAMAAEGRVRTAEVIENGRTLGACVGFVAGSGGIAHTQAMRSDGILREPGHIALRACVEALGEAEALAVDLSIGGGRPGGPKTRLGSQPEPVLALFAASSAARQRPSEALRRALVAARSRVSSVWPRATGRAPRRPVPHPRAGRAAPGR